MCSAWMKRHDILRVPDVTTLTRLLKRQRVTLYRTTRAGGATRYAQDGYWPATVLPEPVSFTL
jgi:hypothetical protein